MSDLQYFVVHYHALTERRRYLERAFSAAGQSVRFIEIEHSNPDMARVLYAGDALEWQRKTRALYPTPPPFRTLSAAEMHNAASHILATSSIEAQWGIILEDDAILDPRFFEWVRSKLPALPPAIGCVFLGGGYPHEAVTTSIAQFDCFHIKTHPATNTVVAYALRLDLARRIARSCRGFDLPYDYELSYLLMANNALVVHPVPYVVREGSKTGDYPSTLETKRQSGC